jgi:hypothetical protein
MTALRDAITEHERVAESSVCGVTADQSTRLFAFCAALIAQGAGSTSGAAIADGIAASAAIVAASACLPQASQSDWCAVVTTIPAIECRKLTLNAHEGDTLELFLDANDAFYLGNLSCGPSAARTILSFRIINEPAGARTYVINGTEDGETHDAEWRPVFGDPFGIAAKATAAALLYLRSKAAGPSPGRVSEASTPPIRFCEQCGQPRKQGARFCGQCGAAFPDAEPAPKSPSTFSALVCSACGAERAPLWKFCKRCGAAFSAVG